MRWPRLIGRTAARRGDMARLRLAPVVAFLSGLGLGGTAHALDLDGTNGLITETIASRDQLRTYDSIKKYGAEAIFERNHAEFLPDGIRLGNFRYFPEVSAITGYDSNIFGDHNNATGDMRSEVATQSHVKSELPRHVLDLSLGGRIVTFLENASQDYADAHIAAAGALHFDSAHTLSANVVSSLDHEERADATSTRFAATPVPIWHNHGSAGITRDVGQIHGTLSATIDDYNYSNVRSLMGGTLDENYRDIAIYGTEARLGWRLSPGFEIVSKLRALRQINPGNGTTSHTGSGFDGLAGISFETSPLLRWRVLGGYGIRNFDQANLAGIGTTLIEGDVTWLPTQRMTITGSVKRQIEDQLTSAGGSNISSRLKMGVEYEIWHNLIATLGASGELDQYQGLGRTDHVYAARLGFDYYATKNWFFTISYEHERRQSTLIDYDSSRDRFSVGAKLRY